MQKCNGARETGRIIEHQCLLQKDMISVTSCRKVTPLILMMRTADRPPERRDSKGKSPGNRQPQRHKFCFKYRLTCSSLEACGSSASFFCPSSAKPPPKRSQSCRDCAQDAATTTPPPEVPPVTVANVTSAPNFNMAEGLHGIPLDSRTHLLSAALHWLHIDVRRHPKGSRSRARLGSNDVGVYLSSRGCISKTIENAKNI